MADHGEINTSGVQVNYSGDSGYASTSGVQVHYAGDKGYVTTSGVMVRYDDTIPATYEFEEYPVEFYVTVSDKTVPLTGNFALEDPVSGWLWDQKYLEVNDETSYLVTLGGQKYNLTEGTIDSQWQSGTVGGIDYSGLVHKRNHVTTTWTPLVTVGTYWVFWNGPLRLYSDYSVQSIIDRTNNANGVNVYTLPDEFKYDSVGVRLYRRDRNSYIYPYYDLDFTNEFTGVIDGTSRKPTVVSGVIQWADLETRVHEFIIDDTTLYTNNDYTVEVGILSDYLGLSIAEAEDYMQSAGSGNPEGRDIYTEYFPLESGSVVLISISPAGAVTEWSEEDDLYTSGSGDHHFTVDHDLGIITTSGYKAPEALLRENISDSDTEITIFPGVMREYPEKGILLIGSEKVFYESKSGDTFTGCERGYDGSTAAAHTAGIPIEHQRQGASVGHRMFVGYRAVPRVECEVTDYSYRTANKSSWLDIAPARNVQTNNILQIFSADLALAELTLETDSPLIGGNIYGPVYYGTDTSRLTATATDNQGNPLADLDVTIEILGGGTGKLGESAGSFTSRTNSIGQIYTSYNVPLADIEQTVTSVSVAAGDTTINGLRVDPGVSAEEIWTFQILKHDDIVGTIGLQDTVTAGNITGEVLPFGQVSIICNSLLLDEDYLGGLARLENAGGEVVWREITHLETTQINNTTTSKVYLDFAVVDEDKTVNFFKREAVKWKATQLNGVRRILYQWNAGYEHPVTGDPGAYAPIHPGSITSTSITFDSIVLPDPEPESLSHNLGGYAVIAPEVVRVRAKARDPISGRIIYSNVIRLKVQLPPYLTGVDRSGALPIPHGFTFITDEFNIGTGLGGANFLTINPAATGTNQFSIKVN